jgi:hypothetical protein
MEFLRHGMQSIQPSPGEAEIPAFLCEVQGAGAGYFRRGTEYEHMRHGNSRVEV